MNTQSLALAATLFILSVGLPLAFFWQIVRMAFRDRVEAVLFGVFAGAYTTDAFLRHPWHVPGMFWRWLLPVLGLFALFLALRRRPSLPLWCGADWKRKGYFFLLALMTAFFGVLVASDLRSRIPPQGPSAELHFPLRGGIYAVAQGGNHVLLNHHHLSPAQRYALDIVKLNRAGMRARGFFPEDPAHYATWEEPVFAPCTGQVIYVRDGLPDRRPSLSTRDTVHPAGNHVIIACEPLHVILAHFREGSIRVRQGDSVTPWTYLGRVGNSGNTTEPHLHIHAVHSGTGQGIPLQFGGRFLVRNDLVRTPMPPVKPHR